MEGGRPKLLITANRNGFFYVLDRQSGEFLLGTPFGKQNWALGLNKQGRPILNPKTRVSTAGTVTWPDPIGATNWQSPTFSPITRTLYVPFMERGQIVFKQPDRTQYVRGEEYLGSGHQNITRNQPLHTGIKAINPMTGDVLWEMRNPSRTTWWKWGGVVSTAGNILFSGDGTRLFILDANKGTELWSLNVGGRVNSSPISYQTGGEQYFAMAAGKSFFAIGLPDTVANRIQSHNTEAPPQ